MYRQVGRREVDKLIHACLENGGLKTELYHSLPPFRMNRIESYNTLSRRGIQKVSQDKVLGWCETGLAGSHIHGELARVSYLLCLCPAWPSWCNVDHITPLGAENSVLLHACAICCGRALLRMYNTVITYFAGMLAGKRLSRGNFLRNRCPDHQSIIPSLMV